MATILIYPYHEPGHLLPTFSLAKQLAERGHRVVYATILDQEAAVVARGFECVPVLRDIFPSGHFAQIQRAELTRLQTLLKIRWRREQDEVFSGRLMDELEAVNPDLMLIDVICITAAMATRPRAIPCLRFSTSLSQRIDEVPPINSRMPHDAPPVQHRAAAMSAPAILTWPWQYFEHALVRFEHTAEDIDFTTTFMPDLPRVPQLVLPPAALDFPHAPHAGTIHAAVPVDLDRSEYVSDELARFFDDRPLVYVSLGSQDHRYPTAANILRAAVAVAGQRSDWQMVVAAGKYAAELAADCPANVMLLERAPQLAMLRRASVFVTHGGMGGIREAVALGTPMIAIPLHVDQFGNAARIEHHGIGVGLPAEVVDAERLTACIARVLRDRATYRDRLRRIEAASAAEVREARAVRAIEERLAVTEREPRREHVGAVAAADERDAASGWMFLASSGMYRDDHVVPGTELVATGVRPSLGRGGFTMCSDVGPALARAEGSLLARVEVRGELEHSGPYVTGRALRCVWQLDATELLSRFAIRCLELALVDERAVRPELVDFFVATFARHREGADVAAVLERVGAPFRHRGYGVGLHALEAMAVDAARFARDMSILFQCRTRVAGAPSAASYLAVRPDVMRGIDDELMRAVAAAAASAGYVPSWA